MINRSLLVLMGLMWSALAFAADDVVLLTSKADYASSKGGAVVVPREVVNGVHVFDFDGNYDRNLAGDFNLTPRADLAQSYFAENPDAVDFLLVFTGFEFDTGANTQAFYVAVKNDVSGIGLPLFDNGATFGSTRLQGYIDMAALSRHSLDGLDPAFDGVLDTAMHELMHRWAAGIQFIDHNGFPSDALLGAGDIHWGEFVDSSASVMGGGRWVETAGQFEAIEVRQGYHSMELYLAGFARPESVQPIAYLQGPVGDPQAYWPQIGDRVSATRFEVTAQQVIDIEGPRLPGTEASQKHFNAALVVLLRSDQALSPHRQVELADFAAALERRFHIATDGTASLRFVDDQGQPVAGAPGTLAPPDLARNVSFDLLAAESWLLAQQGVDFSWQDAVPTARRDTAMAISALDLLNTPGQAGLNAARYWLDTLPLRNIDDAVWRIIADEAAGTSNGAGVGFIRSNLDPDGGTSLYPDRQAPTVLDSTLTLASLGVCDPLGTPGNQAAIRVRDYLLSQQLPTGGWPVGGGGENAEVEVTARAIAALFRCGLELPDLEVSANWLAAQQRMDGSFTSDHETALAILALSSFETQFDAQVQAAVSWLGGRQFIDGSWGGSVYQTALAVHALDGSQRPNLRARSAMVLEPATPQPVQRVDVTLDVVNASLRPTIGSEAHLYVSTVSSPASRVLVASVALPALAPQENAIVEFDWDTAGAPADAVLEIELDPGDLVAESNEGDNTISHIVEFSPSPQVDLQLYRQDIDVSPLPVQAYPTTLTVSALIRNAGTQSQTGVGIEVFLLDGSEAPVSLFVDTFDIDALATLQWPMTVDLVGADSPRLRVVIDPQDLLSESDEDNNLAEIDVPVAQNLDLVVADVDLTLPPGPYRVGQAIPISAMFRNVGTQRSAVFGVEVRAQTPTGVDAVSSETTQLAAGEVVSRSWMFTPSTSGAHQVVVELDPANEVAEQDESNNTAMVSFDVDATSQANLRPVAGSLVWSPAPVLEGQTMQVSVDVENIGDIDAPGFDIHFFDAAPEDGGVLVASSSHPGLAAGQTDQVNVVTTEVAGSHDRLLYVQVDAFDAVSEFSENDNHLFEPHEVLSFADLAISASGIAMIPAAPLPGEPVTVWLDIDNLGDQASGAFEVGLFEVNGDGQQTLIALLPQASIAGHSSNSASYDWLASDDSVSALLVELDRQGVVREVREDNNEASAARRVVDREFYLTEPIFSPNGDGRKDSSTIVFDLGQANDWALTIEDEREIVVRQFVSPDLLAVSRGSIVWDGRNDRGIVVRDGVYQIRLEAVDGSASRQTTVIVDTNRLPVFDALTTPDLLVTELGCYLDTVSTGTLSVDGRYLYVTRLKRPTDLSTEQGLFRINTRNGSIAALARADVLPPGGFQEAVYPLPDGRVVFSNGGSGGRGASINIWLQSAPFAPPQRLETDTAIGVEILAVDESGVLFDGEHGIAHVGLQPGAFPELMAMPPPSTNPVFATVANGGWLFTGDGVDVVGGVNQTTDDLWFVSSDPATPPTRLGFGPSFHWELSVDGQYVAVLGKVGLYRSPREATLNLWQLEGGFASLNWTRNWVPGPDRDLGVSISPRNEVLILDADTGSAELVGPEGRLLGAVDFPTVLFDDYVAAEDLAGHSRGFAHWQGFSPSDQRRMSRTFARWSSDEDRFFVEFDLSRQYAGGYSQRAADKARSAATKEALPFTDIARLFSVDWRSSQIDLLGNVNSTGDASIEFPDELPYRINPEKLSWLARTDTLLAANFAADAQLVDTRIPVLLDLEARYLDAMWPATHGAVTRKVMFRYRPDWLEPTCPGAPNLPVVVESTENLIADLTARSFASVVELAGTASDRHFESYQLEWARAETPDQWVPLESPRPYQQVRSELSTWVPPDPGEYLIRLTAFDQAGNIETSIDSVHWADRASLSQVNLEPRYISPNGDGIQEQTVLSFVVREPINVPVTIEDTNGVVVRNFLGQYPVVNGAVEAIVWDGRDDAGLIVDDGEYLLRVQSRRYRIVVDTQAPVVSIEALPLRDVYKSIDPPEFHELVKFHRQVVATATDLSQTRLEIHSDVGVTLASGLSPSPRTFAQSTFLAVAVDAAGNRTLESTSATPDVLIRGVNGQSLDAGSDAGTGLWRDRAPAIEDDLLRLEVESSVPLGGAQYQYSVRYRADDAVAWNERPIDNPQGAPSDLPWQVVLPFDSAVIGGWRKLEIEVSVQTDDQTIISNRVTFRRPGLLLTTGGGLELDADLPMLVEVLNAGGNLMGREAFDGEVIWSRLEISSPNDSRYQNFTVIPENSSHQSTDSNVSAIGWDLSLLPCYRYNVRWTVQLQADDGTRRVAHAYAEFVNLCGDVEIAASVLNGPQCLETPTDTLRFSIGVDGPNAQYFSHWELYALVGNALQLIRNGTELGQFQLDAFYSNLIFKVSDTLGQQQFSSVLLPPEPQSVSWNQPAAGDRLCAVATGPDGVFLDIPIDLYRSQNINAAASARHLDSGDYWGGVEMPCETGQQWVGIGCFYPPNPGPDEYARLRTLANRSFTPAFNYRPPPSGLYEFSAHGVDVRGANQWAIVVAEVDASVDFHTLSPVAPWARGGAALADFAISPNGDGQFDQLTLESVALEPLSMDVSVWSYPDDGAVLLDTPVTARSIDGGWDYSWDGSSLPEGTYRLVFEFTDDCGLNARIGFVVEIDLTPPNLAIEYPQADSVLGSVVQVTGLYQERNPGTSHLLVEQPDGSETTLARNMWSSSEIRPLGTWLTSGFDLGIHRVILEATDVVGNAASTEVAIDFTGAEDVIWRLDVDPLLFSPNGDGALDFSYVEVGIQNTDVVLDLAVETVGGGSVRTLLDAVATNPGVAGASWDGMTDMGAVVTDGRYVVTATVSETAGAPTLSQSESVQVVVDNTPPVIQLLSPSTSFVEGSTSLALRLLDAHLGDSFIELEPIDPPGSVRVLAQSDGSISDLDLGDFQGMADGLYQLRVVAEDRAANVSESITPLTVDTLPPVAALTMPADGAVVGGVESELEFSGSAQDLNFDHFVIEARAVGSDPADPWTQLIWSDQAVDAGSLGSWPISLPDGPYDIRLIAEDRAGHQTTVIQTMILDTTEPTAELTLPTDSSFVRLGDVVVGTASDVNFDRFELETSPRDQDTWTPVHVATEPVVAGTLAELLVLPEDADVTLRLTVTDQVGLQAQAMVDVTVDATPSPVPLNLVAQRIDPYDVQLDWNAVVADDLAHYQVFKNGAELGTTIATTLLDSDVADGQHQYWVTAVDTTGNASDPSNVVSIRIDRTAPEVALIEPAAGAVVGGIVAVIGTAQAADDFAEYRLYLRLASDPPPGDLIAQSPQPVIGGQLAMFDSSPLLQDQSYLIRLEAEDTIGNLAVAERQVVIDNLPPAAPTGLTATAQGVRDAQLQWNANSESDLAGYLLYRDGVLVNGDPDSDIFAALIVDTTQLETELSDGLHGWVVHAVDQARNFSPPSNPATLLIETGPPDALIVTPEPGFRFQSPLYIQATSADLDIADIQFFARPSGGSWQAIGVDSEAPFEASLDAAGLGFSFGDIDLQALATDTLGQSDPTPSEITVEYADLTPPDAPLNLAAQVIGGDINLSWMASSATDLAGYNVLRSDEGGPFVEITQLGLVTSYADLALGDGLYEYQVLARDQADNASLPSNQASGRVHTLAFDHPYTPVATEVFDLDGESLVPGAVEVTVGGVSAGMMGTDGDGNFWLADIALAVGENTVEFWSVDVDGNQSRREQIVMQRATVPSQPLSPMVTETLGLIDFTWQAPVGDAPIGYRPWRNGASRLPDQAYPAPTPVVSSNDPDASRALDGNQFTYWYPYDADLLSGPPQWFELQTAQPELIAAMDYRWSSFLYAPTRWVIEAWSGYAWIVVATVDDSTQFGQVELDRPYLTDRIRLRIVDFNRAFFRPVRLAEVGISTRPLLSVTQFGETVSDGSYSYQATAVGDYGFEGPASDAATIDVGDVVAPNPVTLSGSVSGADATLNWTASAAGDFAQYVLYRDGSSIAVVTNVAQLSHIDVGLVDGDYNYQVTVFDAVGNESDPSNTVILNVASANIAPPEALQAAATDTAVDIDWFPGPGDAPAQYRLERSVDGGPYNVLSHPAQPMWQDTAVIVGPEYCYQVYALDAIGNQAGPSNSDCATLVDLQPPTVPALLQPTTPGNPISVDVGVTDLTGYSDPGAVVRLYDNGRFAGEVTASTDSDNWYPSVSTNSGNAMHPSPDGRWLFVDELLVGFFYTDALLSLDDESVVELPTHYGSPCWLADSSGLWVSDPYRPWSLFLYDLEGNELDSFADWDYVEWAMPSPSGRYLLAFGSRMEPGTPSNLTALWWVDLISREAFPITGIDPFAVQRRSVAWLPTQDTAVIVEQGGGGNALHRLGSDLVPLELLASITGDRFDISEDGARLLFSDHVAGDPQIFELLIASGEVSQLTNDNNGRELPTYGPGDRWFAARSDCCDIGLFDLEGRLMHDTFMYAGTLLDWTQNGRLVGIDNSLVNVLTPAGLFEQPMTPLVLGLNTFTARSVDEFGNTSDASPSIEVTYNAVGFPDLSLSRADAGAVPQALELGDTVQISAVLRNTGDAIADPAALSYVLYDSGGNELASEQLQLPAVAAGGSYTLVRSFQPLTAGNHQMVVIADPGFVLAESNENNNLISIGFDVVDVGGQLLTLRADAPVFAPQQSPSGSVTVANAGSSFDGSVRIRVIDASGFVYPWSFSQSIDALGFADEVSHAFSWPNATFSGGYQFQATLFDASGTQIDQTLVAFDIAEQAVLNLSLSASDTRFVPGAVVDLLAAIAFEQGNVVLSDPHLAWRAMASDGTVVWTDSTDLPSMLPGYQGTAATQWSLTGVAIGDYRVQAIMQSSRPDVISEITVTVSEPDPVLAASGSIALSTQRVAKGASLSVSYQVANSGTDDLIDLPIELRVIRSNDLTTVQSVPQQISLTPGQSQSFTHIIDSLPLQFDNYSVIISAQLPGQSRSDLASSTFGVIDANPPAVSVVSPMAGSIQPADVLLVVDASDRWSPIERVDLWQDSQPLTLGQHGLDGYYQRWLFDLPEGPNQVELTATDSWGNRSEPLISSFVVDRTAPSIVISGVVDGELRNTVATPVITITDLHLDQSNIQLNGQPFVSGSTISADGSYLLTVTASDLAGNRSSQSVAFTIDRTPPIVVIDYPVDGEVFDVDSTVVNGHTEALADVILRVNGIDYPTQAGADGVWLIASVPLLEGPNALSATATDTANNTGPASAITVHYDAAQPALAGALINVAAELPVTEPATVEFTVENTGNVAFVAQEFMLDVIELGSGNLLATQTLQRDLAVGESAVMSHVFDTTAWPLGSVRFELRSDVAGTPGLLDTAASTVVDRLPPQVTLVQPANGSTHGSSVTVDGVAFDVHSPTQTVTVSVDGGAPLAMVLIDPIAHGWQQQLVGLSHGPHTVQIAATDQPGNTAQSLLHAFDVDAEPPVISVDGVSDNGLYNHSVTPVIEITEPNPGVTSIQLNGVAFVSGTPVNADGIYNLSVQSTDQFGNASARQLQFTVDQTPPVVTITDPVDGFATLAEQISIVGLTEPQAQVELMDPAIAQNAGGDGTFQFDQLPLAIGSNVFSVQATDLAGNVGDPATVTAIGLAGPDINGSITQLADTALRGDPLQLGYQLSNTGDVDVVALPVRVVAQSMSTELAEVITSVDLPVNGSVAPVVAFDTSDWPTGTIDVRLQIDPPDDGADEWLTLDGDSLLLTEILPLIVTNPGNGTQLLAGTVAMHGITRPHAQVELVLPGGAAMQLQADLAGLFTFEQVPVAVGENNYQLQASDVIGSTSPWLNWQLIGLAGPDLAGQITELVDSVVRDQPLQVGFELSNAGDVDVLALPVRVTIHQGADLIDLVSSTVDLPIDSQLADTFEFDTKTWPTGPLDVQLQIESNVDGVVQWLTLDSGSVLVTEILPLSVSYPAYGEHILAGTTQLRGQSRAGAVVEIELSDGQQLSTLVGTDGAFEFERIRVSVGENTYRLRASDAIGSYSDWLDWLVIGLAGSDVDGEITDLDTALLRGQPMALSYQLTNSGDVDVMALPLRVLVRHKGTDIDQQISSHDLPADSQLLDSMELATDSWPTGIIEVLLQIQPPEKGDDDWVTVDGGELLLTELLPLSITSPAQGAQVPVGAIDLMGETAPSAQVELVLPSGEVLTTAADESGLFEFELVPVFIDQNDYQLQASDEVGSTSAWLDWRLIGVVMEPLAIPGLSSPLSLVTLILLLLVMTIYERMGAFKRKRAGASPPATRCQRSGSHE